jgi:ribosomal protein L34E
MPGKKGHIARGPGARTPGSKIRHRDITIKCPECEATLAITVIYGRQVVRCGRCRARLEIIAGTAAEQVRKLPDRPAPELDQRACGKCGCAYSTVERVFPSTDGKVVRRRVCGHCGHKFTTVEAKISG